MIHGIGTDIVKIQRIRDAIAQYGEKFLQRCFTAAEIERSQTKNDPAAAFARLYAAKEALLKALGTGMREGLSWHDLQVSWSKYGAPQVQLGAGVQHYLDVKNIITHLSMSDDGEYATAYAIIEKHKNQEYEDG